MKQNVRIRLDMDRLVAEHGVISKTTVLELALRDVQRVDLRETRFTLALTISLSSGRKIEISNLMPKTGRKLASWIRFLREAPISAEAFEVPYMGGYTPHPIGASGAPGILFLSTDALTFTSLDKDGGISWTFSLPRASLDAQAIAVREVETNAIARGGVTWTGEIVLSQTKRHANDLVLPFLEGDRREEPRFLLPDGTAADAIVQKILGWTRGSE